MTAIAYAHRFLSSLGFTLVVETAVLFLLLRLVFKRSDLSTTKIIFAGALSSAATVPYVWFVFPYLTEWSRNTSLFVSEPLVFVVEALLYRAILKTNLRTSFLASLVCNLSSFVLGPLLRAYGIWIYW